MEVPVQWYWAPKGAKPLGLITAFGDSWFRNNPRFHPFVGMTRKWNPNNNGNINGAKGIRPCGTPDQWLNGCLTTDPINCQCEREDLMPVQEVPTGTIDGTNRVFMLSQLPITPQSCLIFLNGVEQSQGENYTIAGQRITFSPASVPLAPANLWAYYWVQN